MLVMKKNCIMHNKYRKFKEQESIEILKILDLIKNTEEY